MPCSASWPLKLSGDQGMATWCRETEAFTTKLKAEVAPGALRDSPGHTATSFK